MSSIKTIARGVVVGAFLAGLAGLPATATPSDSPADTDAERVVIAGVEYGPEDGLEIDHFVVEIEPGNAEASAVFGTQVEPGTVAPMVEWGSSYARTAETAELRYTTRVKAAGNWYSGKRIIRVCGWYECNGVKVGGKTSCSSARPYGTSYQAGSEASHSVWDTLNPVAPKTIWHYTTTRVTS